MAREKTNLRKLTADEEAMVNGQGTPGLVVVFDLVDSTARKRQKDVAWLRDTALVYRAFQRWLPGVKRAVRAKDVHSKLIGDALLAFFVLKDPADAAKRRTFLGHVAAFRNEVHDDADALLDGVRLKCVATALANVCEIGGERLGRGLDFTFRLEKEAKADRIVVNEKLAQGLSDAEFRRLGFVAKPATLLRPKGFRDREPFVALVEA